MLTSNRTKKRTPIAARILGGSITAPSVLRGSIAAILASATSLFLGTGASAALMYWDGDGATAGAGATPTGTWGTDNFWNTNSTGGAGTFTTATVNTDDLYFVAGPGTNSGDTAYTVAVSGSQVANSLNFQASGDTTISGGTLTLGNGTPNAGGINIPQFAFGATANGAVTISTAITLNNSQAWTNNSANTLTVQTGALTLGAHTLTIGGGGNTIISSIIGGVGGSIVKNGAGTLTLSGVNSYAGATTISAGTLKLGAAGDGTNSALGTIAAGTSVTATGAALDLNGITQSTAEALSIIGTGVGSTGALTNSSGTAATYGGVVTLTGNASIGGAGQISLSSGLVGNFNLNKVGAGTLILNGASTRTGATATASIDGGIVRVRNNTALGTSGTANQLVVTVNNTGILELNNSITLDNGVQATLNNGGTVRSLGTNAMNGRILVSTAVAANNVTISTVNGTDVFTVGNGANDISGGNGTDDTITISGPGTVLLGQSSDYIGNWIFSSGTTQLGAAAALGATAARTVQLNTGATLAGRLTASTTFTLNPVTISGVGTATVLADRNGTGAGGITYTFGALSIGAQTLSATNANMTSGAAGVTFGATTLTGNAIFDVALGGGGATSMNLTLGALTQSGGTRSLTKRGGQTLTLSGASDLAGGLNIEAGTVVLGNTTAAGAGTVTLGVAGDATSGTLNLNGASRTIIGLATAGTAANQIITSTVAAGVLNYTGATTSDFGGVITGSTLSNTALTLNNAGANLTLSGGVSNTYTGLTTVTNGTLVLNKSGLAFAMGGSLTINGGTVQYHASAGGNQLVNLAGVTVSGGTFNMNGIADSFDSLVYQSGTVTTSAGLVTLLNGTAAALSMRAGSIGSDIALSSTTTTGVGVTFDATSNGTATISGGLNINSSATAGVTRTFTIGNGTAGVDMDITGVISNTTSTALTKAGAGTLRFSGTSANTYGGLTTVSAGTLELNKTTAATNAIGASGITVIGSTLQYAATAGNDQINDSAAVTLANGAGVATLNLNGISDTIGSLTIGGAAGAGTSQGIVTTGVGTLTLGGNLSYISTGAGAITHSISGKLDLGAATRTFSVQNNAAAIELDISAAITGTGVGITKTSVGTLQLSGTNSYTGNTSVTDGTLNLTGSLTGSNVSTSGTGIITQTSPGTINGSGVTFTQGSSGTSILAGTNTYTGATAVNAGTLLINSPGSLHASSAVSVASGATLGGSGTIGGTVNISANGKLSAGASAGAVGTLTLSDASGSALTLNGGVLGGNNLIYDLSGATTDLVAITGNLVTPDGTINTVSLNTAGGATAGVYTLMTYAAKTGTGSIVFANGTTSMGGHSLAINATNVQLTVGAGGLNNSVWRGNGSVWDTATTSNWTRNGAGPAQFQANDFVTFDNTGTAILTVTGAGGSPSLTTVDSTSNYVINANIGGSGALIKNNSGNLTLGGTNTYTGGTIINGGTLTTTLDAQLGTGGGITVNGTSTWSMGAAVLVTYARSLTINDGAVLTVTSGNAGKTVTGVLSGNGGIIGAASTGYIFNNTGNTFTGTVNNGYQMVFASLGDSSNAINLSGSNSEFQWTGGAKAFALRPFTLNLPNSGAQGTYAGHINNQGTGALTITQDLAFSGAAGARTLQLNAGASSGANTFVGNMANFGASAVGIIKEGAGTWNISGNMSFSGGIDIKNNNLNLSGTNTYSGTTGGARSSNTRVITFQGIQALSDNTTLRYVNGGGVGSAPSFKVLHDTTGTVTKTTGILHSGGDNTSGMGIFVGNNGVANGGNGAGGTTGGTIALGNFSVTETGPTPGRTSQQFDITGANSYRLQLNNVTFNLIAGHTGNPYIAIFNPTSAPLTIAGTVQQAAGSTGTSTLNLDGTATTNLVSGNILNSLDGSPRVLSVTKSNSGTWTLSGSGSTYSGGTTVSAGTLIANAANALGAGNVTVSGGTLRIDVANAIADTASLSLPSAGSPNLTMNANDTVGYLFLGGIQQINGLYSDGTNAGPWMNAGSGILQVGSTAAQPIYWDIDGSTAGAGGATPTGTWNASNTFWNDAAGTGTAAAYTAGATAVFSAGTNATGTYTVTVDGTQDVSGLFVEEGNVTLSGGTALRLVQNSIASVASGLTATIGTALTQDVAGRGLTKQGAGTLILSNTNSYTGATTINAGILRAGAAGAIGTGAVTLDNVAGAALDLNGFSHTIASLAGGGTTGGNVTLGGATLTAGGNNTSTTFAGVISGTGTSGLTKLGTGTLILTGVNTYTGNTTINGTLQIGNAGGTATLGGGNYAGNILNGGTLDFQTASNQTLSGVISGSGALVVRNSITLTLTGANTYTGKTTLNALANGTQPTVVVSSFNSRNGGIPLLASSSLGAPTTLADATIEMGSNHSGPNPTLRYTGTGETTDRVINFFFNSGALRTLDASGSGLLKFTSAFTQAGASTGGVTLTGTGFGELAGALPTFGSGAFTKSGTGTWRLSGTGNAYVNPTTVSGGTLIVTKPGTVAINAALTVNANQRFVYAPTAAGALNLGTGVLTLGSGTTTRIGTALGGTASQSAITSTGAASLAGTGKVDIYGITGVAPTAGLNNLITAASGLTGGAYTLGTVYNNTNFTVSGFARSGTAISVNVTTPSAITTAFWKGGLFGNPNVWAASDGSAASNWAQLVGGAVQALIPGSTATVNMSATAPDTAPTATVLGADMSILGLVISDTTNGVGLNADGNYLTIGTGGITMDASVPTSTIAANVILGGNQTWTNNSINNLNVSGQISGSGGLTKAGTGTVALTGFNSYSGTTTISAGTLSANSSVALGNTSVTNTLIFTGGTLQATGTITSAASRGVTMTSTGIIDTNGNAVSIGGVVTGAGGLTKSGAGTLTLSGTNTYAGKTTVQAGTLSFSAGNASATADQQLGKNPDLDLGVAATTSGTLLYTGPAGPLATLAKNINVLGNGGDTIQNSGTGLLTLSGTLTKLGTTLTLKGGSNGITVSGVIRGTNGSYNSDLVIDGGTTTLTNANTYEGPTHIINGGTLNANAANALPTANGRTTVFMDQTGSGSTLAMTVSQSIASLTGASTSTVSLGSNTLTVGTTTGNTIFAGVISGTNGNIIKDGASIQTLTGNNTFTGATTINAGTLTIDSGAAGTGRLGGTSGITVNTGGTLLLNQTGSASSDRINSGATLNLAGGTLETGGYSEGAAGTTGLGALTLSATSTLDFGASNISVVQFGGVGSRSGMSVLQLINWDGTPTTGGSGDRLLFAGNTTDFTSVYTSSNDVSFNGTPGYVAISFGTYYEIIPLTAIPEPTTILGGLVLVGLIGYRERGRFRRKTAPRSAAR